MKQLKELHQAISALSESKARVLATVFATMTDRVAVEDQPELIEFRKTIAAVLFEHEARVADDAAGPLPIETLDNLVWPTTQTGCRLEGLLFRGMQHGFMGREDHETAQVLGQLACQLAIRGDQARREARDLRKMTSGVRMKVYWEGEADESDDVIQVDEVAFRNAVTRVLDGFGCEYDPAADMKTLVELLTACRERAAADAETDGTK